MTEGWGRGARAVQERRGSRSDASRATRGQLRATREALASCDAAPTQLPPTYAERVTGTRRRLATERAQTLVVALQVTERSSSEERWRSRPRDDSPKAHQLDGPA